MITPRDLEWAAGFMEGEGSFYWKSTAVQVTATQVQREPLERLQRIFGGNINGPYKYSDKQSPFFQWRRDGVLAASICMTLYSLMSAKRREQIKAALAVWRTRAAGKGGFQRAKTACPQGHPYSAENTYLNVTNGGGRQCVTCRNEKRRSKRRRAAANSGPLDQRARTSKVA